MNGEELAAVLAREWRVVRIEVHRKRARLDLHRRERFRRVRVGDGVEQVHTVEASDCTEAVLQVMKGLRNALGISVDRS